MSPVQVDFGSEGYEPLVAQKRDDCEPAVVIRKTARRRAVREGRAMWTTTYALCASATIASTDSGDMEQIKSV